MLLASQLEKTEACAESTDVWTTGLLGGTGMIVSEIAMPRLHLQTYCFKSIVLISSAL